MSGLHPYFYEIYESIPRQGPGDRESTLRALSMVPALSAEHRILDVGCGLGSQTIDLAEACSARIVAVDNHKPFVRALSCRIEQLGLQTRVSAQEADMGALPFADESFDLVWSEGAIFIIGFRKGLEAWKRLLVPGGYLVVSEMCCFRENPDPELRAHFGLETPQESRVEARRSAIEQAGYERIAEFVLPERGWWENYYVPLAAALERFRKRHPNDPEAITTAQGCEDEIALYRKHKGVFGYVFFVMKKA